MNEKKYSFLAKNTLLFSISAFGSKILTFLLVPLYTNVLSTSDYGMVDILTTTVSLLSIALTFNIASAVMRFALEYVDIPEIILKYGIKVLTIASLIMLLGTLILAKIHFLNWPFYYFIFIVTLFIISAFEQLFQNYLRAIDKIELMVVTSLISTFIKLSSNIILLVVIKCGVVGYMISMVLGSLISCLIVIINLWPINFPHISHNFEFEIRREMRRYAIPTAVNSLGWWIANSVDRYFITAMIGTAINGIYSVAYKIPTIMSMVCDVFIQAWGLSAIKEFGQDDRENFFSTVYSSFSSGLVLVCSLLIFFNKLIAKILFANEFYSAWKYSSILVVSMMFSGLSGFLGGIYGAAKHNDELAISTFVSAIVNIVLNWLLIPQIVEYGAAISTVISFYVIWLIRYLLVKKYIKLSIDIFRCNISYCLLGVQVFFEHIDRYNLIFQSIILVILIIFLKKELVIFIKKIINFIKLKVQ